MIFGRLICHFCFKNDLRNRSRDQKPGKAGKSRTKSFNIQCSLLLAGCHNPRSDYASTLTTWAIVAKMNGEASSSTLPDKGHIPYIFISAVTAYRYFNLHLLVVILEFRTIILPFDNGPMCRVMLSITPLSGSGLLGFRRSRQCRS